MLIDGCLNGIFIQPCRTGYARACNLTILTPVSIVIKHNECGYVQQGRLHVGKLGVHILQLLFSVNTVCAVLQGDATRRNATQRDGAHAKRDSQCAAARNAPAHARAQV